MSLLVIRKIRWKFDEEVSGFEYFFIDYVMKGYSFQDPVQMAAVIKLSIDTVKERHLAGKTFHHSSR